MKLMLTCVCLVALITCSFAAITKAPEEVSTEATAITINPKLRIALFEALSSYNGEESTEADGVDSTTSGLTTDYEDVTNKPFIKIHTFAIDGDKSEENELIKTIIITRPRTTLTPPNNPSNEVKFNQSQDPINVEDEKSNSSIHSRSVETSNSISGNDDRDERPKKKTSENLITKPFTPPTTTTPRPVTNADGRNIEKVAKNDVKISQAPLLAAFTVQEDVNGQSKKVISLFNHQQENDVNERKTINTEFKASQPIPTTSPPSVTFSTALEIPNVNPNRELLNVFEQKQKELEEQIRFLQARQREQDEIIRRHQFSQDQRNRQNFEDQQRSRFEDEQRQREQFEEEQRQRQRFDQEQQFLFRQQQVEAVQQPQVQPPSSFNVQFIPSIPLSHTVGISVQQQPPFKGPFEFNTDRPELQKSFSQFQQQFQLRQFQKQQQRNSGFNLQQSDRPFIQQHEVQQITALPTSQELPVRQPQNFITFTPLQNNLELPQKPFQTFNSAPLTILPSITEVQPQSQERTRVFRHDALQTGNSGFNDLGSSFQIKQQQIIPVDTSLDGQLQNLFQQSGINTRSAEDFRIISKILSSNHGVPYNDFLPSFGRFN